MNGFLAIIGAACMFGVLVFLLAAADGKCAKRSEDFILMPAGKVLVPMRRCEEWSRP